MSFRQISTQASRQLGLRARTPLTRFGVQRRFASGHEGPQLTGPMDNAFNRERAAVKAHAAATSGE